MNAKANMQIKVDNNSIINIKFLIQLMFTMFDSSNPEKQNLFASAIKNCKKSTAPSLKESPNLHTEILNRIVMGNTVMDHEIDTGRNGVDKLELVAIYEVEDGKIARAYFKQRG